MPEKSLKSISDLQLALAIKQSQAKTLLERLPTTLTINAVVSFSAVWMSGIGRGITWVAIIWLAVTLLTSALRAVYREQIIRRRIAWTNPHQALRSMTAGALVSGLVWASFPFALPDFDPLGIDSGIYILMCGMATGAVLLGNGYAMAALVYALPVHLSVVFTLFMSPQTGAHLLALNVLALTLVLYKSSMKGESIVIGNIEAQLQATALAQSLSKANIDITHANETLEILANGDPLTGLANRASFNAALAHGIEAAKDGSEQLALLILDLDRFKTINDTFGHAAGDELLLETSRRLRSALPANGFLARLGGDEFAVIVGGPCAADQARALAEAILVLGREPVTLHGRQVIAASSVGLGIWPDHATTAADLFVCADLALYRAKDQGRGLWREFDRSLKACVERRHRIEEDLPAALQSGEIRPWFQPQIDLTCNRVAGFEALVRWQHAELGFISPPEIVAAAHATGLSEALTTAVAAGASRLLAELPALGLPEATVALNVSPREFELYSVAETLDRITRAHDVDPALIEIEITEEAILDTLVAGEQLKHIERSGYKLAVDDFGAGHSSLAYLVSLKVDRLKLDRRFVTGIHNSRQNQEIVGALAGLGRALSMDVVAEGVESAEEAAALKSLGCPAAQGYLFARPMPPEAVAGWLAARHIPAAA